MADLYGVLGVKKDASEAAIKTAYRRLAKQLHPDRNKDDAKATERFKAVSAANAILSDPDQRRRYDRGEIDGEGNPKAAFTPGQGPFGGGFAGAAPGGGFGGFRANAGGMGGGTGAGPAFEFGGGDPSDLFAELLGRSTRGGFTDGARTARRGPDRAYRLAVPFEDAARLAAQRVALGNGRTLDVKLPPGVDSGTQIRLAGQGDAGPAGAGDALVTLDIEAHAFFRRDGDDVRLDLPVRLDEAVLGAKVRAPTVDGPVTLTVPAGVSSGRVLRLKGKGFTRKSGDRGDQLVTLVIDLPADDAALKSFVEGWASERGRNPRAALGVE